MSFTPVLPATGLVGWVFLDRTYENQRATFDKSPLITRDTAYFEENIGKVKTAEDLVSDRRLLRVALGAFGLQDDINNTFFIQKILEGGTLKEDSLANKMTDQRYKDLARKFGFDLTPPSTAISTFGSEIVEKYRQQQFEVAVGEQDDTMRLALNADRALAALSSDTSSVNAKWFKIMGTSALRQVFQTAFGLPSSISQMDLDKQLELFKDRAESVLGSEDPSVLADDEQREGFIRKFLLRSQLDEYQASTSGSIAQTLLSSAVSFAYSLRTP
ncbi:DUF1217 domain-containing protein [Pseudooceanicola sp. CBS1P-1]|uniref:DUF1217 domain-containing protein n=1 Tax=Pseudooceanicola albus TaxID=2692189 RepID=A0A6L7G8W5_9RHOB|nr:MULTISPECIES: DUF1217 domain-containing protein [Pseudooceanicola]MBT9385851.1 DUF1217 domain-containing protein [Pseudooceanicola endophyticus]MXN20082.1 DUF1217 domain-containing protein [Pseudooceanicola albus]